MVLLLCLLSLVACSLTSARYWDPTDPHAEYTVYYERGSAFYLVDEVEGGLTKQEMKWYIYGSDLKSNQLIMHYVDKSYVISAPFVNCTVRRGNTVALIVERAMALRVDLYDPTGKFKSKHYKYVALTVRGRKVESVELREGLNEHITLPFYIPVTGAYDVYLTRSSSGTNIGMYNSKSNMMLIINHAFVHRVGRTVDGFHIRNVTCSDAGTYDLVVKSPFGYATFQYVFTSSNRNCAMHVTAGSALVIRGHDNKSTVPQAEWFHKRERYPNGPYVGVNIRTKSQYHDIHIRKASKRHEGIYMLRSPFKANYHIHTQINLTVEGTCGVLLP